MEGKLSTVAKRLTPSPIQQLSFLAQRCNAINLAEGFPDFPAPQHIKDAAVSAITSDFNQYRYLLRPKLCNFLLSHPQPFLILSILLLFLYIFNAYMTFQFYFSKILIDNGCIWAGSFFSTFFSDPFEEFGKTQKSKSFVFLSARVRRLVRLMFLQLRDNFHSLSY